MAEVGRIDLGPAHVLLRSLPARSVDMIYADPPFFTQREWIAAGGGFTDVWRWDETAERRLSALESRCAARARLLQAIVLRAPALAYLLALEEIVDAAHRALRPTGTFWLHIDDTAGACTRILVDHVFGPHRGWGTLTWKRSAGAASSRGFARCHDGIHAWVRTGAALSRLASPDAPFAGAAIEIDGVRGRRLEAYSDDRLSATAGERQGWPTQKPVALLRKVITLGTRPGDVVVDPCCGSGTTLAAARDLGRRWIGFDASAAAVEVARSRLAAPGVRQGDLFREAADG